MRPEFGNARNAICRVRTSWIITFPAPARPGRLGKISESNGAPKTRAVSFDTSPNCQQSGPRLTRESVSNRNGGRLVFNRRSADDATKKNKTMTQHDCPLCGTAHFENATQCRRCGQSLDGDGPMVLRQPKSKKREFRPTPTDKTQQRMLFSGLDCLPGQNDLFNSDGPREQPDDEET